MISMSQNKTHNTIFKVIEYFPGLERAVRGTRKTESEKGNIKNDATGLTGPDTAIPKRNADRAIEGE